METLTISRIIFLLFIVVLSVYFVYLNKSFTVKEHFQSDKLSEAQVDAITKSVFTTQFKRAPTDQELAFFQAVNIEKSPNESELKSMILSSTPFLARQALAGKSMVLGEAYGTEDEVSETYQTILNRIPAEEELLTYAKLLKEDKNFNLEKLKQILYDSPEYQRLEMTQSNQVNAQLVGAITDRQLSYMVSKLYRDVVGKELSDEDELKFLKKKMLQFNLDEKLFTAFLTNYIKGIPFNQQLAASAKAQKMFSQPAPTDGEAVYDRMKKELYTQMMQDMKNASLVHQETCTLSTQTGEAHAQITPQNPNKQVIEVLLKTSVAESDNYLNSSDVLDRIKEEASCVFNKKASDKYFEDQEKSMAAFIQRRNRENLKDTCVRNRTYLGVDQDMVLDPALKWTMPARHPSVCVGGRNDYQPMIDQTALIGTLLEDAAKTKVGNVVAPLPPKA